LRVIVYNALIGHVEVVWILHSTWPSNIPDWRRHILPMAFRLAIGGRGRDLRRDTISICKRQNIPTTDPNILRCMIMRLMRNGMRKRVCKKVIGSMGVGSGHLILRAQQGVMRIPIPQTVWCDKGSELIWEVK
jgi:hypothetical protein